jgi:hypothetical protein
MFECFNKTKFTDIVSYNQMMIMIFLLDPLAAGCVLGMIEIIGKTARALNLAMFFSSLLLVRTSKSS